MDFSDHFSIFFEPDMVREAKEQAQMKTIPAGQPLMREGDPIRFMPLVLTGRVKVSKTDETGKELLLYYIHPNEGCAMTFTCCMQQHSSEIQAVTEEETKLMLLPSAVMDPWMIKYPSWKNFVMSTIQSRFTELIRTVDEVAFQKLDERLLNYLKKKSAMTGSKLINLSHEQIANELASSRVVISRLLKKLENDGVVLLYRNQIRLMGEL